MKRGFKAEAERISTEMRSELYLEFDEKLDPKELAEHLAIPILSVAELSRTARSSSFGQYFTITDPDSFSAVTIFEGYSRFIVHNDAHHTNRQASNLEEQASWLGAALLVPREAALRMFLCGRSIAEIAGHFGGSEALCKWRIGQAGIFQQAQRTKRWKQ
jgi:hypothetical protein